MQLMASIGQYLFQHDLRETTDSNSLVITRARGQSPGLAAVLLHKRLQFHEDLGVAIANGINQDEGLAEVGGAYDREDHQHKELFSCKLPLLQFLMHVRHAIAHLLEDVVIVGRAQAKVTMPARSMRHSTSKRVRNCRKVVAKDVVNQHLKKNVATRSNGVMLQAQAPLVRTQKLFSSLKKTAHVSYMAKLSNVSAMAKTVFDLEKHEIKQTMFNIGERFNHQLRTSACNIPQKLITPIS